jgi:hypothetical protein
MDTKFGYFTQENATARRADVSIMKSEEFYLLAYNAAQYGESQHFGGIRHFHLQGQKVSQTTKWFLAWLTL